MSRPTPRSTLTTTLFPYTPLVRSVAAHTGLAGDPRGDDHHVGALDGGVAAGAGELGVIALDRSRLDEIQRLALRHPVDDVEEDDVAQLLQAGEQGQGAADVAGADQRDLVASHSFNSPIDVSGLERKPRAGFPGHRSSGVEGAR